MATDAVGAEPRPLASVRPALADWVDEALERWPVPGIAVALVDAGTSATHVRGVRCVGSKQAIDESTPFNLCSLGKAFTALALARAQGQGLLSLDDPVRRHLPTWRLSDNSRTHDTRLRDLLAHRVGLADLLPAEVGLAGTVGAAALIERMHGLPAEQALRAGFGYANTNYVVAHAALVGATGALAPQLESLWNALGMHHTHTDAARFHADPARARWHPGAGEQGALELEPVWPGDQGAGNVYGCARDLTQWLRFVMAAAEGHADCAGADWAAALRACLEPQALVTGPARRLSRCAPESVLCAYGLGWALSDLQGRRVLMHGGEMPGTRAWIGIVPSAGVGVAVLANASRPLPWAVGHGLLHRLLGLPEQDWVAMAEAAERGERDRWAQSHAAAAHEALKTGADAVPGCGRWTQIVAGALQIATEAGVTTLRLDEVPFWNGRVVFEAGLSRVRFDDPAARDIFGGLEPPLWLRRDGVLHLADFGDFTPA